MSEAIDWYDQRAGDLSKRYEAIAAEKVHSWLLPSLPTSPALVLDVGAGSGRDAGWLISRGLEVVAIEPSARMLAEAQRLHPSPLIRWLSDSLPGLEKIFRLGLSFDLILLSAVWMHVRPGDRSRAFRKLITLLKPGGCIAMTLRHGPAEPERGIYDVSRNEIEQLARAHGAFVQIAAQGEDELGRTSVSWTQLLVRLPDDGTGALPLLRHLILNDQKAATYKLGLLRALCRAADGASGLARDDGSDSIVLPLGLVALNSPTRVIGVSAQQKEKFLRPIVQRRAGEVADLLGLSAKLEAGDIEIDDSQLGTGYGIATPAAVRAIEMAARTEALLLDPVYTGKCMAGLIAHVQSGRWTRDDAIVFVHSGGAPGLFAYAADRLAAAR